MPSVATRRWDTKAPSTLKRNTPGRWPIEQPHTCPPQGVHSNRPPILTHSNDELCASACAVGAGRGCGDGHARFAEAGPLDLKWRASLRPLPRIVLRVDVGKSPG